MKTNSSILRVRTTWGCMTVDACKGLITNCSMPLVDQKPARSFRLLTSKFKVKTNSDRAVLKAADRFIRGILSGKPVTAPLVSIQDGTELQHDVWRYLSRMKPREYVTYGQLAKAIGRPRAARAIGQACGANPVPLFIPCHRVLGAGSSAGGFSCGLAWKHLLIELDTGMSMPELKQSLRVSVHAAEASRRAA